MKKLTNILKPFDVEFQPFIQEIDTREAVIQRYADAATMGRIRGTVRILYMALDS